MASFLQDLQIAGAIFQDIEAFIAGKPVPASVKVGSKTLNSTSVILPAGPAGTPFQVVTGDWYSIIELVFVDVSTFLAGAPIQVAIKVGNAWFGVTLSLAA